MESQAQVGAQVVLDAPIFREAFERIAPEIEKVPESELLPINMETSAAVTMVLGRAPRLRALREEIVQTIPSFNIARYDKVPDYAMAAWHAHTIFKNSQKPVGSLQDVAQVAERFRDLWYTDLQGLAKRGLIKNDRIKDLKPPNG